MTTMCFICKTGELESCGIYHCVNGHDSLEYDVDSETETCPVCGSVDMYYTSMGRCTNCGEKRSF